MSKVNAATAAESVSPRYMLSFPHAGKHVAFDGRFVHGAVPLTDACTAGTRITFLANIWLNHIPLGASPRQIL